MEKYLVGCIHQEDIGSHNQEDNLVGGILVEEDSLKEVVVEGDIPGDIPEEDIAVVDIL